MNPEPIPTLSFDAFSKRFEAYLESSPVTRETEDFEAAIEAEACQRLVQDWQEGWDFETRTEYFDGRGASILLQNQEIAWEAFWEWLRDRTASIPPGALINLEGYDSIKDKAMIAGPMLLRRVVTASGIFEEECG